MLPRSESITAGLASLAGTFWPIAVAWHLAFLVAFVAFARGWRPARSTARRWLVLPLLSVAALAARGRNPFNTIAFALTASSLWYAGGKPDLPSVSLGGPWLRTAGSALLAFGWFYPHFLAPRPASWYLFAAPVGIVPCPTLAMTIGATLALGGLGARLWCLILGSVGLFYGLFGTLRLGVRLDVGLVLGAAALLGLSWQWNRRSTVDALAPASPEGSQWTR